MHRSKQFAEITNLGSAGERILPCFLFSTVFTSCNRGVAVIEAEHAFDNVDRSNRNWLTQSELAGYVGSGYMSALPDTDLQFTTGYTASPQLQYDINFTTTGVYTVWLRGYAPNAAGDSLYVGLDDQPATTLTGFASGQWSWANGDGQGNTATIEVTEQGLHILHLWMREDGLRLDRILLTTDSGYNPVGAGPPESEINQLMKWKAFPYWANFVR